MWKVISGVFLGWGLGSNDSANIFGTGVAANILKYRTAIILISGFVILGALLEGHKGMDTVGKMVNLSDTGAFIAALGAGLTVAVFSYLALPISTSQAIMGAILGIGLISGIPDFSSLYKVMICWVLTPIGAMVLSMILYPVIGKIFNSLQMDLRMRNIFVQWALIVAGCYGAYSLGCNNVANVTGVYVGSGMLTPFNAALIGSLSITGGVLTYSKKVMETVGKKIIEMDGFSAFISEFSAALTVHFFTQVGVPVSTSQAIVGAVVGVGIIKGTRAVKKRTLMEIGIGWVTTPLASGLVAYAIMRIYVAYSGGGA